MMHVSAAGRDLIERNEGLELTAYPDPATGGAPWTIGRGDTGPDVVPGLTITLEEANERFAKRLAREFEPAVNRVCEGVATTQGQFDAMVSLAYNIGVGAFAKSSVARLHKAGNYEAAAEAFSLWNKAGGRVLAGLTRRREEEADLYMSDAPMDERQITVEISPELQARDAPRIPAPLIAEGHQKAIAGPLAVQGTQLLDKLQSMFTGIHMDTDTILLIAAIAVGLVVWKIRSGHKAA